MSTPDGTGPDEGWQQPAPPPPPPPPPPQYGYQQPQYGNQQPQYGQERYGPQAYSGYNPYQQPKTEGTAIAALVAACASWVFCPVIPAVVALVLASTARRKIATSNGLLTGENLLLPAKIVAWLNIALFGLGILFAVVVAVLGAATAPDSPSNF